MATSDRGTRPIITLTTDFGTADPYVPAMKGVIFGLHPDATVVDISHDVGPQQLDQAVFITQSAWPFYPPEAIHVVVVDPGVGSERPAIGLATPRGFYLGPDNGVLSAALPEDALPSSRAGPVTLPEEYRAVEITNTRYMREPVSATFHGRDVFAPVAAHVALGVKLDELGERTDTIVAFPPLRARQTADGALAGRVVHVDRFGNVVTDIRAEDLPDGLFLIEAAGQTVAGPVRTYADAIGLAAVVGSSGYVEIALPSGHAARALRVAVGEPVLLRRR